MSSTARRSAVDPSISTRMGLVKSRPRSRTRASRSLTRGAAEQLGRREQFVCRRAQLAGAVRVLHPRALHGHPPAAEGDAARLAAAPIAGSFGAVLALRPRDVGVHPGLHHLQAGAERECQQPFRADSDTHRAAAVEAGP